MWISDFSIRNPVITIVLVLALVMFGGLALFLLDTDEFPEVNPPVISISVPYPGASPETVEREVVDPMEEAFAAISGVDEINSTALDGFAILIVIFVFEKDLQQASQDIRDKISEIRRDLPPEMEEPVLTRFDPNDLPIISLTLSSSTLSATALTRLADPSIVGALRSITGVAEVTLVGGIERELTVELNPQALATANIGVMQVVQALQTQNLATPVGRVTGPFDERTIRLRGRLKTPAEFAQIVVTEANGKLVRLGDLAQVSDGTEEPRSLALLNGEPAVGIDLKKSTGYSTTAVSKAVRARLAELQRQLPPQAKLTIVRDSGMRVKQSVSDVEQSLAEGAMLTVLVVFVFLMSWRSTVITGLALPVSVLASFIAVFAFDFTLNTLSLLGLSLAIGILIDDAIVVRENIIRHMEMGKAHGVAAREGTDEIGLAVMATTFSIVVVFVPIAFMGGVAEQWFAPFALTIACSVLVSLFVSFSLDPMLSATWADPEVEGGKKTWITRRLTRFNNWFERQTVAYKSLIRWALNHRLIMVVIATGSFLLALAIPAVGIIGTEFFPRQDRSEFSIRLETPPGSNLNYTRLKALMAVKMARDISEVAYTYTTISGQGEAVDEATIYVRLVDRGARQRSQEQITNDLRSRVQRIAGATVSLVTGGFSREKQIQVQLTGTDVNVLSRLAEQMAAEIKHVKGAADVSLSSKGRKPEFDIQLDRALAGSLGISLAQVTQALRPAFAGIDAGDWVDPEGETRDVTVRLLPQARNNLADLEQLPLIIPGQQGTMKAIPLGQVAHISRSVGPTQINHLDRRRVIIIGANTEQRTLNQVVSDIDQRLRRIPLPPGYAIEQGGETESQQEVFGRIFISLAVAVVLMYLILVIQFRSFLDPIPIMASLPLSLIGVMLALLITGSTLNLMSMIGVILLMGIVAKNAILLIDFAKWQQQQKGVERKAAIIEAGGVRLRPILMTSVAIIAGMSPIALGWGEGGDFRAPLGRAVIGGVITSTFLTLLVIPTAYDILAGWRDTLMGRFRK